MKVKVLMVVIVFFVLVLVGCSAGPYGKRSATLKSSSQDGVKYSDSYVGFFMPMVGPEELSRAELNQALAEKIRKGQAGDVAGKHIGVLVNQDESRTVTLYHPTRNSQIEVPPGRHTFIYTTEIPDQFNLRWSGDDDIHEVKAKEKKKIYNGVRCDFGQFVWYNE